MRLLTAMALCVPLGGCFSLAGPAALPEWAMNPQQQVASETQAKPRRVVAQRPPSQTTSQTVVADRSGAVELPTVERPAGLAKAYRPVTVRRPAKPVAEPASMTAFSPEWQAREDAAEAKLKRSMKICNGC